MALFSHSRYADTAHQRREGALAVLLMHFERSLDAEILDKRWRQHPFFAEYVQCALADAPFIPSDVRKQLVEEFGERAGMISKGHSYWPADAARQGIDGAASLERLQALRAMVTAQLAPWAWSCFIAPPSERQAFRDEQISSLNAKALLLTINRALTFSILAF